MSNIDGLMDELRRLMVEQGVSRSELARRMGIDRSTVSDFFNIERVSVRYEVLARYFSELGVELGIKGADIRVQGVEE